MRRLFVDGGGSSAKVLGALVAALAILPLTSCGSSQPTATATALPVSYSQDVQPILNQYCVRCHGGNGGLYLDSYAHVMQGSRSGAMVVPGNPDQSLLVGVIEGTSMPVMPPGGQLPGADIQTIRDWVQEGAPDN